MATAGHCENDNYQRNPTARILFKSERNKGSYDVQWGAQRRGGVIFSQSNEIIVDGAKLAISEEASLADMTPGTTVCKFGVTTGRTCGSIKDAEFAASWNGEAGTYVQVVSLDGTVMNRGGDSGGPVYAGSTAYGLVHGRGKDGSPWENDLFSCP
ncbi:S1 family peptidase [Stenotrophomonas indicatrix]|uniref:S1 family peptidase n=1 Tax=Stenotrophomonas indicatrix TaxID=2045451 RepID=UPI00215B2CDF|nr:S1 family peptidase [Stenotrophomonas indicatrix]MCR8716854.1 S1 family peptidase [Stenotrophomonas indicatrix]